ncbi:MAG: DUF4440 domain-containing protein [Pseudonocardia sp.]|nr:DUF4440 domain-containing protein [Pseudonocardia sp.]
MTFEHDNQPVAEALISRPADLPPAFVAAFNSGDAAALERLYDPTGIVVPVPGHPASGANRSTTNAHLLRLGLPMQAQLRHAYLADDVALLIVDWSIDGQGADGDTVHLAGAASDVVRRSSDGGWRYLVDNPHGTAG